MSQIETKCSICSNNMINIPIGNHIDKMCPECESSAPIYCTKKKDWK
jgi:hypothetical protein